MAFEWDSGKAQANFKKHGVWFPEAELVFKDDYTLTVRDEESDPHEVRYVSIGMGAKGRILVVVYCYRKKNIRIISARVAGQSERRQYEESR